MTFLFNYTEQTHESGEVFKSQELRTFETKLRPMLKEMGALQLLEEQRRIMFERLKSSLNKNMKDK